MPRALIVGGTGPIGCATALRLLAAGWQVDLTGRNPAHVPADIAAAGATFIAADRGDRGGSSQHSALASTSSSTASASPQLTPRNAFHWYATPVRP